MAWLTQMARILDTGDPEERKKLVFDRTFSEIYMRLRTGDPPFCIKCVEVCPIGMKKGKKKAPAVHADRSAQQMR